MLIAQTCLCTSADDDITIAGGWPKTFVNSAGDDVIWDVEPIDVNEDGTTDGYIVAGSVDAGGSEGKNIYVRRLNANGTEYTGGSWPINEDGQNNVDAAYAVEITPDKKILVCGSKRTSHFNLLGIKNKNAWVMKYNLDGTNATGWPSGGIEYGGDGDDEAYDIKAVSSNSYIVAGMAGLGTDDVPTNAQGDGDYWVFNINGTGTIITGRNKVYFGTNSNEGNDYARSIAIDCNTGKYVISGFCKSCAPEGDDHSQLLLLKIPANFGTEDSELYGYDGENLDDYGSYQVIQTQQTLGDCTVGDGFLSIGLQHPNPGCYGGNHDFWAVNTQDDLSEDTNFNDECVNANAGQAYGGKKKDNGHSVVQICDGYLLAGITESNNKKLSCDLCQVSCNHYDCTDIVTEDIWLAKISGTGELVWNESIGTSGNDGAYVLKYVEGDSYIVAGYTTSSNGDKDWYLVKFSIPDCSERLTAEDHPTNQLSTNPNPSTGSFSVALQLSDKINESVWLQILDVAGKEISAHEAMISDGSLQQQILSNELQSGFYLARIVINHKVYQSKIIIQN